MPWKIVLPVRPSFPVFPMKSLLFTVKGESRNGDLRRACVAETNWRAFRLGAGDGNRTHVTSLEGWSSTIELHPHAGHPMGPAGLTLVSARHLPSPR